MLRDAVGPENIEDLKTDLRAQTVSEGDEHLLIESRVPLSLGAFASISRAVTAAAIAVFRA